MTPEWRHRPWYERDDSEYGNECEVCRVEWPCDAEQMRIALAEAEQREDRLYDALSAYMVMIVRGEDERVEVVTTEAMDALAASLAARGPRP